MDVGLGHGALRLPAEPRHTETPTPEGVGGTKPSSEISGTMLRTGGRLGVGSKSRIIHRQSAASNPVTPTPKYRMASGRSRPESHGGRSNSNQNRRTVGCVNLVTSSLAHKRSGGNGAAGPAAPTDSELPAQGRCHSWPGGSVVPPQR